MTRTRRSRTRTAAQSPCGNIAPKDPITLLLGGTTATLHFQETICHTGAVPRALVSRRRGVAERRRVDEQNAVAAATAAHPHTHRRTVPDIAERSPPGLGVRLRYSRLPRPARRGLTLHTRGLPRPACAHSGCYNEYVLLDHIPHDDAGCHANTIYAVDVAIPDVSCDHCVLQVGGAPPRLGQNGAPTQPPTLSSSCERTL